MEEFVLLPFVIAISLALSKAAPGAFLSKHEIPIENFIMNGHGRNWKHCDVMLDEPREPTSVESNAQFMVDRIRNPNVLGEYDIASILSSSHCLLVSFHINDSQGLSSLIEFGRRVSLHKRIALVLKLTSGVALDSTSVNVTKLPFLIAAKLEDDDKELWLCPIIGQSEPLLQSSQCDYSYSSYKNKVLKVAAHGAPPYGDDFRG